MKGGQDKKREGGKVSSPKGIRKKFNPPPKPFRTYTSGHVVVIVSYFMI